MSEPLEIVGPWDLRFPPKWGAPDRIDDQKLVSWSEHPDPGVKYFSGTATYAKTISVPGEMLGKGGGSIWIWARSRSWQRKVNGKDLGILWRPPYRVDVTGA